MLKTSGHPDSVTHELHRLSPICFPRGKAFWFSNLIISFSSNEIEIKLLKKFMSFEVLHNVCFPLLGTFCKDSAGCRVLTPYIPLYALYLTWTKPPFSPSLLESARSLLLPLCKVGGGLIGLRRFLCQLPFTYFR